MVPQILTDTYHRYKENTDAIATWLANTATKFGVSTDILSAKPAIQKSKRLKGKARQKAKEAAAKGIATDPSASEKLPARQYTITVGEFVPLAEFLASKVDLSIPAGVWESINQAIRLRQLHSKHHIEEAEPAATRSNKGHLHFLGILEKVRDILRQRVSPDVPQYDDASPLAGHDAIVFENMFAGLTVEEPSEAFLNAPDAPKVFGTELVEAVYTVEPFEDRLELYIGASALLQDLADIRDAVRRIWLLYLERDTSLVSAAVATNIAIRQSQSLEAQFLRDYPSQKDTLMAREMYFGAQLSLKGEDPGSRVRPSDPINLKFYDFVERSLLMSHLMLESFADVLSNTDLPLYKSGHFGYYDGTVDRSTLSGPEKFDEDKAILSEILSDIVFFDYVNRKNGFPAADEFSKEVSFFREQRRHTLALDFAGQVHLDIQHVLRARTRMAWDDLRQYSLLSKTSLEQNFTFHADLSIKNWGAKNDKGLREILEKIKMWIEHDTFQDSKDEIVSL
jgi:hypothetical protein